MYHNLTVQLEQLRIRHEIRGNDGVGKNLANLQRTR